MFEIFKDDIFLKKVYIEWFKTLKDFTINFSNGIAKSLKIIYQEREKFEKDNRNTPFCKLLFNLLLLY